MRTWLSLARLGGIALALGLFASATATTAGAATIYEVEPANVFAARGVELEEGEAERPSLVNDDARRRKRAREAAVETILGYNPFCDDCPEPVAQPGPEGTPPPATASTAPPSVQVLATMEAVDPAKSLATIYDPVRGTRAAAIGDALEPGVLVAAIGAGQLTYSRGAATGVLQVGQAIEAEPTPKASTRKPNTTDRKPSKSDPLADKVKCDAGKRCTIERSLIQDVMANPSQLGGLRAFPSSGGFKIAGVRRGSVFHQLGLRNGDVLTGVGGKPLESLDDALSLLPLLRSASNIEVTLSRKGKPITHEIEIV